MLLSKQQIAETLFHVNKETNQPIAFEDATHLIRKVEETILNTSLLGSTIKVQHEKIEHLEALLEHYRRSSQWKSELVEQAW